VRRILSRLFIVTSFITAFLGRRGHRKNLNSENWPRLYAYIGKSTTQRIVVVTSQGVVVIDTGNNQPETRNILKNIQAVHKHGRLCHHHAKPR